MLTSCAIHPVMDVDCILSLFSKAAIFGFVTMYGNNIRHSKKGQKILMLAECIYHGYPHNPQLRVIGKKKHVGYPKYI